MKPYLVALGLSDALLAGPAEQWSAHARCARALDATPPWLPALCRKMTLDFASRWHDDFRHVLAEAICSWPQFLQAWASEHRPYLRYYFVESPRMGARPLALEHCALPDIPTVGAIADWLRLDVRDVDWLADCRGREASAADERLRHYRYCWVRKRTVGYRLLEMPKTALRTVQRRILRELLEYVPPHDAAHGFRARHSCLTHARQHVGQDIVIRMDLKDFFLSFGTIHQTTPEAVNILNFEGIFLSPQQAKALANVLNQNVSQYESAFGEIRLEPKQPGSAIQ